MICPDCSRRMSVVKTVTMTDVTQRVEACVCGSRFETVSRIGRRLNVASNDQGQSTNRPHLAVSSPPSNGGFGGPLPSGLVLIPSDPISDPKTTRRDRARERNEYPAAFEEVWRETKGKGSKFNAHKAWDAQGKPRWETLAPTWRAYLLSDRPAHGFIKDLSSWFNGRYHLQQWTPFLAPVADLDPPWKAAERAQEARRREEAARGERAGRDMEAALERARRGL